MSASLRGLVVVLRGARPHGVGLQGHAEAPRSEDPMKCERDPKCDKKRGRTADCSRQCNDDPACVERCEQVQYSNGGLGH